MKITLLRKGLASKSIDVALFLSQGMEKADSSFQYLTSYTDVGILAVPSQSKPFIILPGMDVPRYVHPSIKAVPFLPGKRGLISLQHYMRKQGRIKRIGVDFGSMPFGICKDIKKTFKGSVLVNIGKMVHALRLTKTKEEIELIKKACFISDHIMKQAWKGIANKTLKTEQDVEQFIRKQLIMYGCEPAFSPIVASGKSGSVPHHTPKNAPIGRGFLVIDMGARYKGYRADITRTVFIGTPTIAEKAMYQTVLHTQQELIKSSTVGTSCESLYTQCLKLLGSHKKYFIHGLGHGIGIDIHEAPSLSVGSKETLQEGMVFTIEPGVYPPNKYGIRIEDDLAIINGKTVVLTKSPKNFHSITLP